MDLETTAAESELETDSESESSESLSDGANKHDHRPDPYQTWFDSKTGKPIKLTSQLPLTHPVELFLQLESTKAVFKPESHTKSVGRSHKDGIQRPEQTSDDINDADWSFEVEKHHNLPLGFLGRANPIHKEELYEMDRVLVEQDMKEHLEQHVAETGGLPILPGTSFIQSGVASARDA